LPDDADFSPRLPTNLGLFIKSFIPG